MKYNINKLSVKTTNSFHVNDTKIELEKPTDYNFKEFKCNKDIETNYSLMTNFTTSIGFDLEKYQNIDIKINKEYNDLIEFIYEFEKNNNLICNINLDIAKDIKNDIVFKFVSKDSGSSLNYINFNIKAFTNSNTNITIINLLNEKSTNLISCKSDLDDYATVVNNLIDLGANIKIYNYKSNLMNNSISKLNNIYIGKNKNIIDMNYEYINKGINSNSNIEVQGMLDDNAKKVFRGIIDFKNGSKNAVGCENENVILLSDDVISRSAPILLCTEEDVSGSHSVSSGKIDEDKLFYLLSKSLDKKSAQRLIIKSNFNKVLEAINDDELKEEINKYIENYLK